MNKIGLLLLPVFAFFAQPLPAFAQELDPSEVFLKAYMTAQQGEKLERENQLKPALSKFRFAGSMLEELKKSHGDWQPAIVDYRGRKIGEAILRVQSKLETQKDLAATESRDRSLRSRLTLLPRGTECDLGTQARPSNSADVQGAIQNATKELRARVDALEAELQKSQKDISTAQKEKSEISGKLLETDAELEQAKGELARTSQAEKEVRDQLLTAQESLQAIQSSGTGDQKAAARAQDRNRAVEKGARGRRNRSERGGEAKH